VIVHGESGSGKTALVEMLRKPVCAANGYFVEGKFFQLDTTVPGKPYSAIMAAFSDLCDLVIQSDDYDEDQRRVMKESLGSEAQLLVKSISNLSPLVGAVNQIEAREATSFAQFKVACRTFLRSVASEKHPVVMFLDDIQWAATEYWKLQLGTLIEATASASWLWKCCIAGTLEKARARQRDTQMGHYFSGRSRWISW
jgi:predicted ATPase